VDRLFSSLVDLGSGVVGAVAGHNAGARTHQVLAGVADQVESAMTAGAALRRELGGSGSDLGGSGGGSQQWGVPDPPAAKVAGSGRGDASSAAVMPASSNLGGCDRQAGSGCSIADNVGSAVWSALRGRGPPLSLNLRNNTIGNISSAVGGGVRDRFESAVSRLSPTISSLVDDNAAGPMRAEGSKGGNAGRPAQTGSSAGGEWFGSDRGQGQPVQAGSSGGGSTRVSGIDDLAQGITQLVQSWLASNGLGGRTELGHRVVRWVERRRVAA
jgi:hypothetical protein